MSSVKRRLLLGFGVNTFGKLSNTVIQIVSVTIFLKYWSLALYGDWLLLNSLPSYLNLSDIGFGNVAGNEMTMLAARGDREGAIEVFQSVWVLITLVSTAVGVVIGTMLWFLPLRQWLKITQLSQQESVLVILLLGSSVYFGMQEGLMQSAFRCVGEYSLGTFVKNCVQLISFAGVAVAVVLRGRAVAAAEVSAGINLLGTVFLWVLLRRRVPWIRFGWHRARYATVKRLFIPAVSFMSFPLGNALSLQGTVLLVGHILGPVAVVVYSTARTVTRSANQALQLINNSIWPEVSIAFGAGNLALVRKLHRYACQIALVLSWGMLLLLSVTGNTILRIWTHGKVPPDRTLFFLMLLVVVANGLWMTSSTILAATNRHQRVAVIYLGATLLSFAAAIPLMHIWGLSGAAVAVLLTDLIMSTAVLRSSLKLLEDPLPEFLSALVRFPSLKQILSPIRTRFAGKKPAVASNRDLS